MKKADSGALPRVLYLGDLKGTSARYLVGAMQWARFPHTHHDATEAPPSALVKGKREWDVIVLSDYGFARLGAAADAEIARQVRDENVGLVMLGGWASFTGLDGGYRGSAVSGVLPVRMLEQDDRRNYPTGLVLWQSAPHPVVDGLSFRRPPTIAGYNAVTLRSSSNVVMQAWELRVRGKGKTPTVELGAARPMLVTGGAGTGRTAAFMSDLAPHWCGGMVDWGRARVRAGETEVGEVYVEFIRRLLMWMAGSEQ